MAHSDYSNLFSALKAYGISVGAIGLVLLVLFIFEWRRR